MRIEIVENFNGWLREPQRRLWYPAWSDELAGGPRGYPACPTQRHDDAEFGGCGRVSIAEKVDGALTFALGGQGAHQSDHGAGCVGNQEVEWAAGGEAIARECAGNAQAVVHPAGGKHSAAD